MSRKPLLSILVFVLAATCIATAEDDDRRSLVQEAVIDAPVERVWAMFTVEENITQWMAPKASLDLRVGGELRTSYHPESDLDDEHAIVNRILSYLPQRMIAMQNVQAPESFEHAALFQEAWSVITFEPVNEQQTHVRIAGLNYGTGPQWDVIYQHFETGNDFLLRQLQTLLEEPAEDNDDVETAAPQCNPLVHEATIEASRDDIWRAWTTAAGLESFFAPKAIVELELGGMYELHFLPDAPAGERGAEGCEVLAYEPKRMLSVTWNAPPHLPEARKHYTWIVLEFLGDSDEATRVRLTQLGFAQHNRDHPEHAAEFDEARAYFDRVWPHVLDHLKSTLEGND